MASAPTWITVLQALLTPAIAAAVGIIGYLQWRTAHQKVMLDLFDRRIAVVKQADDAILLALAAEGNMSGHNASRQLWAAYGDAIYLFGPEVSQLISEIRGDAFKYSTTLRRIVNPRYTEEQREHASEEETRLEYKLIKARIDLKEICHPYLNMPQKKVRTPSELFHDLNKKRLSYADEKQRR